jgi:hypothetical protein
MRAARPAVHDPARRFPVRIRIERATNSKVEVQHRSWLNGHQILRLAKTIELDFETWGPPAFYSCPRIRKSAPPFPQQSECRNQGKLRGSLISLDSQSRCRAARHSRRRRGPQGPREHPKSLFEGQFFGQARSGQPKPPSLEAGVPLLSLRRLPCCSGVISLCARK